MMDDTTNPAFPGLGAALGAAAAGASGHPQQPNQDGQSSMVLQAITAMSQFQQKSFEELRLEDHMAGNRGEMLSNEDTTTNGEPEKALDYLGEVRGLLNGSFNRSTAAKEEQLDIEHNISVIRAILAVNSAIFSRCMEHVEMKGLIGEKTQLARFGFETIKTRQEGTKLELVTQAERFVQAFDTHHLSKTPSGFDEILVVKHKPFTMFVDFDDLFRKTLLLNDDALEFLLPRLKEHLESVQVCLGELDEWALQTTKNASFINGVFEKEYVMPRYIDHNPTSLKCWYCGSSTVVPLSSNTTFPPPFSFHTTPATAPKPLSGAPPATGSMFGSANNSTSLSFGAHPPVCTQSKCIQPSMCTQNKCKQVHVLAEFDVSFIYQDSFDISQESEQAKIQRFLYFVKGA